MKDSFVKLDRRFLDVTNGDPGHDSQASMLLAIHNERPGHDWSQVLSNDCVVILGTAGSGKTTEILNQAERLREKRKPAFVLRLENLCRGPVSKSFSPYDEGGEASFNAWMKNKDEAIVFLDALDEARLPDARNSSILDNALVNLSEGVGKRSKDIRIVLTTRPSEWHGAADSRLLQTRMKQFRSTNPNTKEDQENQPPIKLTLYRIAELDKSDIRKLAEARHVDADRFLEAIDRGLSADIASQPLDVEFLMEIWTERINNGVKPEQIFHSRSKIFEAFVRKRVRDENEEERRSDLVS